MLPSLKIRGKLILSFSVAMMLVLCTLGYVVYHTFASSTRIDKQKIAGLHLEVMTSDLVQLAASERLSLRALEQNIADGAEATPLLRQYLRNTLYAEGVLLVDDRGVVRESAGETSAIESLLTSGTATNINPISVGSSIVLPGSDASELQEGRLLAAAQIGGIELLRSVEYDSLPAHSVVIIAHEGDYIISNHDPLDEDLESEFAYMTGVARPASDGSLASGTDWYGMRQSVETLPVELWYLVPKEIFQADILNLQNRVVAATIVLLWLTIWIVLAIAHKITLPIRELTESIATMKEEEYAVPLNYRDSGDETAALAKGFEGMRQHIDELISIDPLTSLYNRRYLMRSFVREINRARRSNTTLCCMMLDIDRFKNINDSWGHP
ncbi:MAG: diguanylate cyclase, partial [Granulosicoccaceae bacterium]